MGSYQIKIEWNVTFECINWFAFSWLMIIETPIHCSRLMDALLNSIPQMKRGHLEREALELNRGVGELKG